MINTDNLPDQAQWQADGVDHIIKTQSGKKWCVDFMLRNQTFRDCFLETHVGGKPGKFVKDQVLTDYIAYSYKTSTLVIIFEYQEGSYWVNRWLQSPEPGIHSKTADSMDHNRRKWQSKGLIVPHSILKQRFQTIKFIDLRHETKTIPRRNNRTNT